jgi:hypothetical protein
MRISTFWSFILWFVGLSLFTYFSWTIEVGPREYNWKLASVMGSMFSVAFWIMYSIILTNSLRDIVAFKYRIIDDWRFEAQVQTSFFLFIPYWVAVDTESHSYKSQNMFGAKYDSYYSTDVRYETEEEALKAIEYHKKEVLRNRNRFFERPKKDEKKIKYV